MRLSVVVPIFRVEDYLHDCLLSLARQTYSDLDVVMVDDGSDDASADIAARFAERDARFRLISQHNQGLGPARNTGVAHAEGELLTFVDSDDIVPRHAYELMIASLRESGSDFVAGNARRFNVHGSRASWSHTRPFAKRRLTTHVSEFPEGALDRMVWNKVYRKSFWDEVGLSFLAMVYEDYPVTLRGHLAARLVDFVEYPVYYWRERDAGEHSITQRALHADNLRDRVRSAQLVIGMANDATPAIRSVVQSHLFEIDLVTAAKAAVLARGTPEEQEVVGLGQQLCAMIDDQVVARRQPADRVMARLLQLGMLPELTDLMEIKAGTSSRPALVRSGFKGRRYYLSLPFYGQDEARVPAAAYRLDPKNISVHATVSDVSWRGATLTLELRAFLAYVRKGEGTTVEVWLQRRGSRRERLPLALQSVALSRDGGGLDLRASVDAVALLDRSQGNQSDWEVRMTLTNGGVTRSGAVRFATPGRPTMPPPFVADDRTWIQPGKLGFGYVVRVFRWQALITDLRSDAGQLLLGGTCLGPVDAQTASLRLEEKGRPTVLPATVAELSPGVWRWDCRALLDLLVEPERNLDLVPVTTDLTMRFFTGHGEHPVAVTPGRETPRFMHEGRELQVRTGTFQLARLVERSPEYLVDSLLWDGTVLRVHGRSPSAEQGLTAVLQWYDDPDNPTEVVIDCKQDEDRFELAVDVASLQVVMGGALDPRPEHDSTDLVERTPTQWDVLLKLGEDSQPANITPQAMQRLPDPLTTAAGVVALTTHRGMALRLKMEPRDAVRPC